MLIAKPALLLAAHFFALSAAAQVMEVPVSAPVGRAAVPAAAALSGSQSVVSAAGLAGTSSLPAPVPSLVFSAPLHVEPASSVAPLAAEVARALPLARALRSAPRALGSVLAGPVLARSIIPALSANAAPQGAAGEAFENERPAARIAASEDRVLRSVFGGRREAEFVPPAVPLAFARPGLSAASSRLDAPAAAPVPALSAPAPEKKDSPFLRLVTGLVLMASQIALIHWAMLPFAVFTAAVSALMLFEYGTMMNRSGHPVQRVTAIIGGASFAFAVSRGLSMLALPIVAGVILLRELFHPQHSFDRAAATLTGAFLLGWLPGHLALIREMNPHGQALTFMFMAAVWATDTFSYLVGKYLGRHKLAPVLSPNKTWEGAIGGFLAAVATTFAFAHFMPDLFSLKTAAIVGAAIGAVGQISGLVASMIKRSAGVKDSGSLLPGHGGFLDRFDSVLFTAPLVYWLLRLFH